LECTYIVDVRSRHMLNVSRYLGGATIYECLAAATEVENYSSRFAASSEKQQSKDIDCF